MSHATATVGDTHSTPSLREAADAVFEQVSPYEGFGFRNHCRRLHRFVTMLMDQQGLDFNHDVAYMVAMWHDLGLVSEKDEGVNYLRRSWSLFERESARFDLGNTDHDVLRECMLYNHRVLPVPGVSPEAECFRRAVIIEHTRGLKRWGLPRGPVREVFDEYPRGNFDRVLLDFTYRTLRHEPMTLVRGIFF